jgi:Domain of unknown function (DUF4329)
MLIDPFGLCGCGGTAKQYKGQTEAAKQALRSANPLSIAKNLEYCGNVCKDRGTGEYFTTGPLVGTLAGCRPAGAPCPSCSSWVGYWHTHGAFTDVNPKDGQDDYDSENFSPADQGYADRKKVDGYLGTPSGAFKHYPYGSGKPYSRGRL